jgi:ribosomal protein S18 acetylase RimI-like enzyme
MLGTVATIRPARADDRSFLETMLVEAANWNSERAFISRAEVLARPDFAHYVEGWPRDGDVGVVAEDAHGEPVGAAWCRYLSDDDPGYGFIDSSIPEVTIGVVPRMRGKGVGLELLNDLATEASRAGVTALSLSVEKANPAMRLYRRQGYVVVREVGDAATLRLDLSAT